MVSLYVVGDIHGQLEQATVLLREAGLLRGDLSWGGGDAQLWFMGDFFDRGPDGIGVVELVMRLQGEAAHAGGSVHALLGNHEPLILAAQRFPRRPATGRGGTFLEDWLANGGVMSDLKRLTVRHVEWLTRLPAMARVGDRLFAHADARFYTHYGWSVEQVNRRIAVVVQGDDAGAFDRLLGEFGERNAFSDSRRDGVSRVTTFLRIFGGWQLVHGHTPIGTVSGLPPSEVREPLIYAQGRCVNVDGDMARGGPGFVYRLPPLP